MDKTLGVDACRTLTPEPFFEGIKEHLKIPLAQLLWAERYTAKEVRIRNQWWP